MLDRDAYRIGWEEATKKLLHTKSVLSVSLFVNVCFIVFILCILLGRV